MLLVRNRGLKGLDIKRAIRLQLAPPHFMDVLESLLVNHLEQFIAGERLALQRLSVDLAVADQDGRAALEHARQPSSSGTAAAPPAS